MIGFWRCKIRKNKIIMFKIVRLTLLLLALAYVIWLSLTWIKINKTEESDITEWRDGIAVSKENGKYGYVNEKLKPIIRHQYDYAQPFDGERAIQVLHLVVLINIVLLIKMAIMWASFMMK